MDFRKHGGPASSPPCGPASSPPCGRSWRPLQTRPRARSFPCDAALHACLAAALHPGHPVTRGCNPTGPSRTPSGDRASLLTGTQPYQSWTGIPCENVLRSTPKREPRRKEGECVWDPECTSTSDSPHFSMVTLQGHGEPEDQHPARQRQKGPSRHKEVLRLYLWGGHC